MAKLIVAGAAGRMGRILIAMIARDSAHRLVGAVEMAGSPLLGKDAGEVAGAGALGVAISDRLDASLASDTVMLDFTNAAASLEHLRAAAAAGAAIVIGSTGFTPETLTQARELGQRTRTVIAPNMSLGINVLLRIVAEVARILPEFDAEVVEVHHRTKLDAPSGTALALGQAVAQSRGQPLEPNLVFGREGLVGQRPAGQIAVLALRAGDAVGDHTVIFGGQGERLELTHRSQSRESLARGALHAAAWLEHQAPAVYSMREVLGL